MIYMRLRVDLEVICLYQAIQIPISIQKEKNQKGKKVHEFYFRFELDLYSYLHATLAFLKDFENFDNFDHIFYFQYLSAHKSD